MTRAVQENYYDLSDLNIINYSEVCEWCNFPDLQDGGIYEQAIDVALMCRSKQRRYIVLEQVTEWDGTPQENA